MPRYHTSVNVTQRYVSALIAEPQDREQRLRPMFEAEGATLLTLYFSPDEAKLIVLWEAPDPASLDALFLAVMAGGVTEIATSHTMRILTGAELADVAGLAGQTNYAPPGS